ncbi:MAG: hypothetical protein JWR38_814 [Mucilaginibacter sp.]|nr:hypothetical protein [Mucilaginibacter sp.]
MKTPGTPFTKIGKTLNEILPPPVVHQYEIITNKIYKY